MSSANLANLNVDALFEQHSIAEIDIVQKKIQTEVEKKREELRTMVGERYRDLLKAADTIATMRESSSELCNQIDNITTNCRSLNEKQLIGFKTADTDAIKSRSANKQLNNYFSTVVQIKLLTTLPEMIWSHIDNERFYLATELFIFSRHISTGLQLDVNNTLMQYFPVAKKQWEILKPFHLTIKQSVLATLEREELSPEAATDCLLSLLLLEKGNLNGILKTFVQLRCSAFLSSMINEGGDQKRVKDRILGSLRVINSTVQLVHKCFFENNKGLVSKKLEELENAMPTITHIDCHDSQFAYLLPDIIANFRPKFDSLTLNEDQVKTTIETWLNDSSNIAAVHLKTLFNLVSSMKIIQEIKKESVAAFKQDPSWSYICERFGIAQKLDFYEFQYKPLINQRIRDIIRQSWIKANNGIFKRIEKILKTNRKINNDLWIENASDLPMSLKDALSEDKKIKKLLMKSKGYDVEMISICSEFNDQLAAIVCEMNLLLDEQETKSDEKLSLVEFLKETSEEQIQELMSNVKNANCDKQLQQLLFLVRLLAAIVELCPNLRACLSQSYHDPTSWATQPVAEKKTLENWTRMCNLLEEEGFVMWKRVCELILDENPVIAKRTGHETILEDFANWETVTIEQKDEQDNPVQSTFRIPSQPRISLQQYLFSVTNALNLYIPQTLPQKVLHVFNSLLTQRLLEHYKSLVEDDKFTASSQNTALQLYYDVKFLQSVFTSRDDRSIVDEFNSITNLLKDFIDPFDFELFSEHISMNVKKSVTKMHCQLGVIIPHLLQNTSSIVQQEKDPNVLTLSSNGSTSIWFPLLPIITPGSTGNTVSGGNKSSTTPMHTEAEKDIRSFE
ncbi:conserved oligomeric Golgi complex subunit 1 isoform X2 [Episyrphus balteatus]|uniref:conserved oligomeric Golgi complex subunit 1 isoform X2 n=1 Tax=Episyrphus balteatus TaxID=286459 RepID=UPI002486AD08|nr:conserved oligomeric Golgi complex subunit 1 isoform X2 [Episyrphus balteatus]